MKYGILAIVLLMGLLTRSASASDSLIDNAIDNKVLNCGVSASAFILRSYGREIDLNIVARQLGTSTSWDQAVDLDHIKSTLELYKLNVEAYKDATINEVVSKLKSTPGAMAIIHVAENEGASGHYYVLSDSDSSGTIVIDAGRGFQRKTDIQLNRSLGNIFSGYILFVSDIHPSFNIDDKNIVVDVGEIGLGVGDLRVLVLLKNPLDHDITFKMAKAGCSCFKEAILESGGIPKHGAKDLTLVFDRSKLPPGAMNREIVVSMAGYPDEWVKIFVRGYRTGINQPMVPTWIPDHVTLGNISDLSTLSAQEVTLFIPEGIDLGKPIVSSGKIRVLKVGDSRKDGGVIIYHYVLDFSGVATGPLQETASFTTTSKETPEIKIPITGNILPKK